MRFQLEQINDLKEEEMKELFHLRFARRHSIYFFITLTAGARLVFLFY